MTLIVVLGTRDSIQSYKGERGTETQFPFSNDNTSVFFFQSKGKHPGVPVLDSPDSTPNI